MCWARSGDMDQLQISNFRTSKEVLEAANCWKAAVSLNQKEVLMKETGVRWSEFNRLTYRNPVTHLPIGMMHNWFEGVLHHHFRYRWGFVLYTRDQKLKIKKRRPRGSDEINQARNPQRKIVYEEGGGNTMDVDDEMDHETDTSESDVDAELDAGWDGGLFSKAKIKFFRNRMRDLVLPNGISRLPLNLGESNAGSLKAAQWHSLFAYVIPLIIPELYVTDVEQLKKNSNRLKILLNIGALCQCTNILCAKKVSEFKANHFKYYYKKYSKSSREIFSTLSIKPNHH